ncbi:MAG: DNA polymerase [Bdellovibrionota bacterium]
MYLVLDLNSYFASVEQQLNPKLRGKPVAVVPSLADTTSCIAASYEAKAFGIKTGTMVREAKSLCPELILVVGDHKNYIEYHHKILTAIDLCVPIEEVMSIDEVACKLIGRETLEENSRKIALLLKSTISERVGAYLKSSIGIAPNKFLAKIASNMQKPDGLTFIRQEELPTKLYSLKLRDFPGIGAAMEDRLVRAGIYTSQQLCAADSTKLKKVWGGIMGEFFYKALRGENVSRRETERKSFSHSHVLPPELRSSEGAYAVAQRLLHKASVRLRKLNYWCRYLYVSVRYVDGSKWFNETKMIECQDDLSLIAALQSLWVPPHHKIPMKISLWMSDLVPDKQHTESFFEDKKSLTLSKTLDSIQQRFGKEAIYFAGTQKARRAAPLRISFTNIPDIDLEND